jgi:hypothetical protein
VERNGGMLYNANFPRAENKWAINNRLYKFVAACVAFKLQFICQPAIKWPDGLAVEKACKSNYELKITCLFKC